MSPTDSTGSCDKFTQSCWGNKRHPRRVHSFSSFPSDWKMKISPDRLLGQRDGRDMSSVSEGFFCIGVSEVAFKGCPSAAEVMCSTGVLLDGCKMQWYHRCQSVLGESGLSLDLPLRKPQHTKEKCLLWKVIWIAIYWNYSRCWDKGRKAEACFWGRQPTWGDSAEETSLPKEKLGIDLRRYCETRF